MTSLSFKTFFLLLLLALAAHGQEKRLAILPTEDDGEPQVEPTDLTYLTMKLREIAGNVLQGKYGMMTEQSIIDKLGKDNAKKACKEAEGCLAQLGRKISADYIGQARLGRFGGNYFTISFVLYNVGSGMEVSTISGNARDVFGLLTVLDEKAPGAFAKMPGISSGAKPGAGANSPTIAGGIGGVQTFGGDYELKEKLYLVRLSTEPPGAVLSFNGEPDARKTPYSTELSEGKVRIIAVLDQHEKADTTVSIKQNNQSINIKLKPNFGVLEIKPAYSENIGGSKGWSLLINNEWQSSYENNLSPGNYDVKLSHECYEDINFRAGINKGKREVFDMAAYVKLKKGGLILKAERNGEPVSEPVYVNGKQSGETPFSGTVPLCATIELGKNREKVDVALRHNEKVTHTVRNYEYKSSVSASPAQSSVVGNVLTDSRDGKKYKTVKMGNQVWMAENLNYNASGSKCNDNKESNCPKYGRLYDWNTAQKICPSGWHLPSYDEWNTLIATAGGKKIAGKYLKATSDWYFCGNSGSDEHKCEDRYGFSALPGGYHYSSGVVGTGSFGNWWSSSYPNYNDYGSYLQMSNDKEDVYYGDNKKSCLLSVRCLQGSASASYESEDIAAYAVATVSSFKDSRDGKTYKTTKIGNQTWMAENLNYNVSESMCYDEKSANCNKYGRLYNWETAMKACPAGWHLPSQSEWDNLWRIVGGVKTTDQYGNIDWKGDISKLRTTTGWSSSGTDYYGFSALPGGKCYDKKDCKFKDDGVGSWWTSTPDGKYNFNARIATMYSSQISDSGQMKEYFISVRCLKD